MPCAPMGQSAMGRSSPPRAVLANMRSLASAVRGILCLLMKTALISDLHANRQAFEAVLDHARRQGAGTRRVTVPFHHKTDDIRGWGNAGGGAAPRTAPPHGPCYGRVCWYEESSSES